MSPVKPASHASPLQPPMANQLDADQKAKAPLTTTRTKSPPTGSLAMLPVRQRDVSAPTIKKRSLSFSQLVRPSTSAMTKDEPAISMAVYHDSIEQFEAYHVEQVAGFRNEVENLKADVSELRKSLERAQSLATQRSGEATEANDSVLTKDQEIKNLISENEGLRQEKTEVQRMVTDLQTSLSGMESKLKAQGIDLDLKSQTIADQIQSLDHEKLATQHKTVEHREELDKKDREIIGVRRELATMKEQLDAVTKEKSVIKTQLNSMRSASAKINPKKSEQLADSGEKIADHAQVLQALNTNLLAVRKDLLEKNAALVATNVFNKEKIKNLQGQLVKIMQSMGIDPEASQ